MSFLIKHTTVMLLAQVNDRENRRKEVLLIIVSGDEVSEILEDTSVT